MNLLGWETFGVLTACTILIAIGNGSLIGLGWAWAVFSALRLFASPISPYADLGDKWQLITDGAAASALCSFVLVVLASRSFPKSFGIKLFRLIGTANAIAIIVGSFWGAPWGLFMNASMAGCFSAVLLPLYDDEPLFSMLLVVSIAGTLRSQPLGLLALFTFIKMLQKKRYFFATVFGSSVCYGAVEFFNSNGRFDVWVKALRYFEREGDYLLGQGAGSFSVLGPMITQGNSHGLFTWLHSDWLQILFEQGAIGLGISLTLFASTLFYTRKDKQLFASIFLFGTWMLANMPLRFPIAGLLGAFLIRLAYWERGRIA